jgi:aminobenzoyl-glutamate transport protein
VDALGPIFVPMLYQVNPQMTPDLVAAAYRVADSSTNIVTPMMFPYSACFLVAWTGLLLAFFVLGLPFGF